MWSRNPRGPHDFVTDRAKWAQRAAQLWSRNPRGPHDFVTDRAKWAQRAAQLAAPDPVPRANPPAAVARYRRA